MTKDQWDYRPNIGASEREPSVRTIITQYYLRHFETKLADEYIRMYLQDWEQAWD